MSDTSASTAAQQTEQPQPLRPVRFDAGRLVLLDQRRLPSEETNLEIADHRAAHDAIADLAVRGAPAIGLTGAYGVLLAAREADTQGLEGAAWCDYVRRAGKYLSTARPTAVNLSWAINRMLRILDGGGLTAELAAEAEAIATEDIAANLAMGRHGLGLVPDQARMLTHCNAGALATAGYGTALGVIRAAWAEGKLRMVYATETRPVMQGARLTAWELSRDGIPVTLLPDSAAPWLMARGEIDAIVVGADRVAANGDVANKIGTYGLAVAAKRHGIPFYVAAGLSTLDRDTPDGEQIVVEERDAREVTHVSGIRHAPEGIAVRNPAFDVTPAELVSALITEVGVLKSPYGPAIAAAFERAAGTVAKEG